ncbi:MAG: DapH/DapD/GlmU-related protein [Pseudomonadota bacterium]
MRGLALIFKVCRGIASILMRLGYRHRTGIDPLIAVALYLFPQKILRINGMTTWPVDFRSKVTFPQRITVGTFCFPGLSPGCYIQGKNGIHFGDNVRLGPNVGIISANHSLDDYEDHIPTDPIEIGDNVWIGMNSVVMPGVKIGNNVVIGAGSVVTRDIPPNSIAVGNPCKVRREKEPYTGIPGVKIYGPENLTQ